MLLRLAIRNYHSKVDFLIIRLKYYPIECSKLLGKRKIDVVHLSSMNISLSGHI